jgi:hypothetical protein
MSQDIRWIIATMILSFSCAFALMWWQRKPEPWSSLAPESAPARPLVAVPAYADTGAQFAAARDPGNTGVAVKRVAAKAAEADAETPPSNYDGPPLPVVFVLGKSHVYEEEPDGGAATRKRLNEGIIFNSSDKPLTLTAIEVNLPTMETSQAQFVLTPGMQKHFSVDDGLKMISGDQITLRASSFQDMTKSIP